ncbi:hypothetical protein WUBG_11300 [Wuchereria bancrofti]|uniref:Uncharacterized protein n=1 Tax=Wuchereria bancrofti TaxID=6293 RepID=J9E669_WUCBA|nr:hypothetical protein WUBG_11300 [Wuchereria bancrofti]
MSHDSVNDGDAETKGSVSSICPQLKSFRTNLKIHCKYTSVSIIGVAVYLFISILSKYDLEYQLAALLPKVWEKTTFDQHLFY